jgi:hypothetical protein
MPFGVGGDEKLPEIVQRGGQRLDARSTWDIVNPSVRPLVKVASLLACISVAGWFFQNFLQLRGFVDLLASRIDLGLMTTAVLIGAWITTTNVRNRNWIRILLVILFVSLAFGIDRWAPKPQPRSDAKIGGETSPRAAANPDNQNLDDDDRVRRALGRIFSGLAGNLQIGSTVPASVQQK